jgi:diacylglycerol kinase (ATP)
VNYGAGSAGSERTRQTVELARRVLDAEVHATATRDAATLAGWMAERVEGYRRIVIAGGDGSLGVAYNVLTGRDVDIGYIPAGYGNATAHLLQLPRDPGALVQVLLRGEARPVDLVQVGGRLALFAGAGWDALVAGRYAATGARRTPGWAAAVARSLPDLVRRRHATVVADGRTVHDGPMVMLVAGTTPWYGRGLLVNPGASAIAGLMTVRIYSGPLPGFALESARWVAHRQPAAAGIAARQLELRTPEPAGIAVQADGDLLGTATKWQMRIRPGAARLIGAWEGERA